MPRPATASSATFVHQGLPVRVSSDGAHVTQLELLPLGRKPKPGPPPKDPVLKKAVAELKAYLVGKRRKFSVPFKQSGTPFQQAVWQALLKVPYGRVISYGDLAREAGYPKAARAVGSAMNRNRVPLIVPCHRVVASNGIGGFGCGLEWKKRLLGMEKAGA
jgi:methylated-DNA-[protein]-cysteine S-methyltransferase